MHVNTIRARDDARKGTEITRGEIPPWILGGRSVIASIWEAEAVEVIEVTEAWRR